MSPQPTVVVTGASTGIGRTTVQHLADRDVRVVAAVRDLDTVVDHPLVTGVRLDVTEAEEARAAASTVADLVGDTGLHGLFNNAGVAVGGPLEHVALDDLRRQLEVNVIGQVAVTQAFLPLCVAAAAARASCSRDRSPGWSACRSSAPTPPRSTRCNGLAESLRRELRPGGIGVSVLAPGTVSTPIWGKAEDDVDAAVGALPPEGREHYGDAIAGLQKIVTEADDAGISAEVVAKAAHHALFSRRPKAEYLVGTEAKTIAGASAALPYRLFDRIVAQQMRG
ncbi:MAG: SDR family NAD(P)-dependent oxidoreductase [Aeromicrobium erythreum]